MGCRIHKNIGFLLTQNKVHYFFKENYRDILENFHESDKPVFLKKFQKTAKQLFPQNENSQDRDRLAALMIDLQVKSAKKLLLKGEIELHHMIQIFSENSDACLFSTPSQAKNARYDDIIDYYECPMEEEIRFLHTPIYPDSGYIYKGGLEDLCPEYKLHEVITDSLSSVAYIIDTQKHHGALDVMNNQTNLKKLLSSYFHPKIDPIVYVLAKTIGILKDDVSMQDFNLALEPAIVSYWS